MNTLYSIVAAVQICAALAIIGLVLVQHGKGADMGAAFGSGASGSLFGATGSSSFLSKATAIAAVLFFSATLGLAYLAGKRTAPSDGVMDNLAVPTAPKASETVPTTSTIPADGSESATSETKVVESPATAPAANASPAANSKNRADQIPK